MDEARIKAAVRATLDECRRRGMFGSWAESTAALYKRDLAGAHTLETVLREAWEESHPPLLDQLLADATESRSASDALHLIAAHHLRCEIDMPGGLKAWMAEHHCKVAERRPTGPALGKGRDPDRHLTRNASIQLMVMQLQLAGLPATKNEATNGLSACQIIADESGLSAAAVQRVWVCRKSVPILKRAYLIALHWYFRECALNAKFIPIKFTRPD